MIALACTTAVLADERGDRWLAKIDSAETVPHSIASISQTITTSSGSDRTLEFRSFSADSGKVSLMVYTAPARVENDKILLRDGGDQVWYYMQRRDITRHYAGHALRRSAMGSDFSYEDLAQGEFSEDYQAEYAGEQELDGEPVVRLRCTPTPDGPSYDHVIIYASTVDNLTRKVEYFDEDGPMKTLTLGEFKVVDGRKTAHVMTMVNHRENSRTVMRIREIRYDEEPDASLFTKAALARRL